MAFATSALFYVADADSAMLRRRFASANVREDFLGSEEAGAGNAVGIKFLKQFPILFELGLDSRWDKKSQKSKWFGV